MYIFIIWQEKYHGTFYFVIDTLNLLYCNNKEIKIELKSKMWFLRTESLKKSNILLIKIINKKSVNINKITLYICVCFKTCYKYYEPM